jgi:hypothetical protein
VSTRLVCGVKHAHFFIHGWDRWDGGQLVHAGQLVLVWFACHVIFPHVWFFFSRFGL